MDSGVIDLTHLSCGLIPKLNTLLSRSGAGRLTVRVGSKKVFPVINALAGGNWGIEVQEHGQDAVITFSPLAGKAEDVLHRV